MRGLTSGFGVRISSIGLLIVTFVSGVFIEQIASDFHRAHDSLNERDFARGKAVLLVEVTVRPWFRPVLGRNERVDLACNVLRWFVKKYEETRQPTAEIGQGAVSLAL